MLSQSWSNNSLLCPLQRFGNGFDKVIHIDADIIGPAHDHNSYLASSVRQCVAKVLNMWVKVMLKMGQNMVMRYQSSCGSDHQSVHTCANMWNYVTNPHDVHQLRVFPFFFHDSNSEYCVIMSKVLGNEPLETFSKEPLETKLWLIQILLSK